MMKIMTTTLMFIVSLLLIVIILKLLGYSFNKDYFGFDQRQCIESEYETRAGNPGIQGCVFWMRNDYLEKLQSWRDEFATDIQTCNKKYDGDTSKSASYAAFQARNDPRCNYNAFKHQKREENWNYLVSREKDGFYEYCVEQICPNQPLFE